MSVFITPGLRAMTATPGGNSFATDFVRPSTAHFEAQYGATCRQMITYVRVSLKQVIQN